MGSKTDMAILGMLTIEPMSGYDMKQFCEESLSHFWYETFGNLYPRLKRLTEDGLVRFRRESRDQAPDANVYSLTARGRTQLRNWLLEPPDSEHVRSEFMLKFFFGADVPADVHERRLLDYEKEQNRVREQYKVIEHALRNSLSECDAAVFWLMSLRRGQLLTDSRIRWCRECLGKIAELKKKGKRQ